MATDKRWKNRPENSTWGDYGPDDQLGRMNELTSEKVKQGIAEVKEGKTFCLSMPLDYPGGAELNPRRHPPQIRPTLRDGKPNFIYRVDQNVPGMTDVINDDMVLLHLQYSTQWDTLAHVGSLFDADGDGKPEPVFYNGYRGGHRDRRPDGRQGRRRRSRHVRRGQGHIVGECARRREHGREVPAGPRGHDRSVRALRARAARRRLRRSHAHHGRRRHQGGAGRLRVPPHRLR